jgi:hypothetical protein
MEVFKAIGFYWRALCRGFWDTFNSFGLWTLSVPIFGIAIAIAIHIYLVRRYPGLKDRLGDPMTRWWIWLVYTLLPLSALALLMGGYNVAMAPLRIYNDLANAPKPAPVGDPQDAADIKSLTRKLLDAEEERDSWRAKLVESEREKALVNSQLEAVEFQLDDREQKRQLRTDIARWIKRLDEFKSRYSQKRVPSNDEFNALKQEFVLFARSTFDESQLALLESQAGMLPFAPPNANALDATQADQWRAVNHWCQRLLQIMQQIY